MMSLQPLRIAPIFKKALWGGTRLRPFLRQPPSPEPTGEAWLLSDVDRAISTVADGPFAGVSLRELMLNHRDALLGPAAGRFERFPLLLKFIDTLQPLSVQVHPNDLQARVLDPQATGKSEGWVILEAERDSVIHAGLRRGVSKPAFEAALRTGHVEDLLFDTYPLQGDCYYIPAGTVHAIGAKVFLFEIQQSSDITYRLFDWNRTDPRTGQPRELHVEQGNACIDYGIGPCPPMQPTSEHMGRLRAESLIRCPYFTLDRWGVSKPFRVGLPDACRAVVVIDGSGVFATKSAEYPYRPGDVYLIPASVGQVECRPEGSIVLLECGLPRTASHTGGK